ncbi:MAG: chromosome partitioning protein ParB, partial [Sandarakinorhabdus sp.]|nr:chromosome partitioning protein ParB [Sandarakinorhabdus sp.]
NLLRLLDLPEAIQTMVESGQLAMGHARALIGAADPVALAIKVVDEGLSVRTIEALVAAKPRSRTRGALVRTAPSAANDANADALEIQLADALGMPVALSIAPGASSGSLTLRFASLDQLDWICVKLGQS